MVSNTTIRVVSTAVGCLFMDLAIGQDSGYKRPGERIPPQDAYIHHTSDSTPALAMNYGFTINP